MTLYRLDSRLVYLGGLCTLEIQVYSRLVNCGLCLAENEIVRFGIETGFHCFWGSSR